LPKKKVHPDGIPAWNTTLLRCEYFLTDTVQAAMAQNLTLLLANVITGGRNGVLISPFDPITEATVDHLFTMPKKQQQAAAYIKQIWFTPPELCSPFHNSAYECWMGLQKEKHLASSQEAPTGR
jgi:hypothetical protein